MTGHIVNCGYVPLIDCAPLIIAKELSFAAQEGLDLRLHKQPSWSALRDRVLFGQIDVVHMLAPMPIAMTLGLGGVAARMDALMVMSVNGTVTGVSDALHADMAEVGWTNTFGDPVHTAEALFASRTETIRIGVPFPFSMHRLLLERWLTSCSCYAPNRIEIVTVPPPQMADAVLQGKLDMFCVGEPWGSVAVQNSNATLILPGSKIWGFAPEKVLGARHDWVEDHPEVCMALVRALYRACLWLDTPQNIPLAVEIMAHSRHLDLPDHAIDPALSGRLALQAGSTPTQQRRLVDFHRSAANFPWRSQAAWIASQLAQSQDLNLKHSVATARTCFRSDLYRAALGSIGADLPGSSDKIEGAVTEPLAVASSRGKLILAPDAFFDGKTFDSGV